jgi:hypothetical protein
MRSKRRCTEAVRFQESNNIRSNCRNDTISLSCPNTDHKQEGKFVQLNRCAKRCESNYEQLLPQFSFVWKLWRYLLPWFGSEISFIYQETQEIIVQPFTNFTVHTVNVHKIFSPNQQESLVHWFPFIANPIYSHQSWIWCAHLGWLEGCRYWLLFFFVFVIFALTNRCKA